MPPTANTSTPTAGNNGDGDISSFLIGGRTFLIVTINGEDDLPFNKIISFKIILLNVVIFRNFQFSLNVLKELGFIADLLIG